MDLSYWIFNYWIFQILDFSKKLDFSNSAFSKLHLKIRFVCSFDFSKLNFQKLIFFQNWIFENWMCLNQNCSKLDSSFFKNVFLYFFGPQKKPSAARVPPRPEAPKKGSYIFGTSQFEFDVRRCTFQTRVWTFRWYSDYTMDPKTSA